MTTVSTLDLMVETDEAERRPYRAPVWLVVVAVILGALLPYLGFAFLFWLESMGLPVFPR